MELIIATKNPGKIREIKKELEVPGLTLRTFKDFPDWPEVAETGLTLEENARIKAEAVRGRFGRPALADDSGLMVDYLDGRPGVDSSKYAGVEGDSERNIELLLSELEGASPDERSARFVCVIALALPHGEVHLRRGECCGTILPERRGAGGFGYDPVFQPAGCDRSLAELPIDEKNAISHRGKALRSVRSLLEHL